MPPLSRWYLKSAVIYLVAALLAGAVEPFGVPLDPARTHLFTVGWITQMIFGVAYWMFPKHTAESPRGNNAVALATFVLLNVGLLTRLVFEPLLGAGAAVPDAARDGRGRVDPAALRAAPRYSDATAWAAFVLLNAGTVLVVLGAAAPGRLAEFAAAVSFALHIWRRVVPAGLSAM